MALMIWTRSADDWEHDKPILEATDVDVLHLPCIAMTGLPVKFPKRKPQMFIFTSANAVRYSSRHPALFNLMRTSEGVLAVGPGTKESLKSHKINAEVPLASVMQSNSPNGWRTTCVPEPMLRGLVQKTLIMILPAHLPDTIFK